MSKERYVYYRVFKDYGRVVLTVNNALKERNINVYKLSKLTGIKWDIIKKYVDGRLYRVDLDLLSRMCYALDCTLDELVHYENSQNESINTGKHRKRRKTSTILK